MALGRPVVGYIDPEVAQVRPDLPIVNATHDDLAEKLEMLVKDQRLRLSLGEQGRRYVEKWHDANKIAEQVIRLYEKSMGVAPIIEDLGIQMPGTDKVLR
jgi:glycosyltransferase involved in cell wall biosynthesis